MAEREELDLVQLFEHSRIAEQQVDEHKLDLALQKGMERGRMKRKSTLLKRRWGIPAGVLAYCLLLIAVWQFWSPITHKDTVLGSQIDIPDYVADMLTLEMKEAVKHGLYQPMNQMVTHGGYKVTIDGVLADNNTMVVFYTSEYLPGNVPIRTKNPNFVDKEGKSLEAGIYLYDPQENPPGSPTNTEHGHYVLEFYDGHTPEQFTFSGKWGIGEQSDDKRVQFDIPVKLDPNIYTSLEKNFEVNQKASISGHEITITEATIRPLSTTIRIQYNHLSNKKIQSYLTPQLYIRGQSGNQTLDSKGASFSTINGEDLITSMYFPSLYYTKWDDLSFLVSGIEESIGKDLKLVIDTETKKLISAPDAMVELLNVIPGKDSTDLQLKVYREEPNEHTTLNLNYEFTDADGTTHSFKGGRSSTFSSNDNFEKATYQLEPGSYPQPLTFDISTYPGKIIKENVRVKLK
ncbi:DUF4179 domain-containing protein [Paenibacillus segetis]|uniref:DUF4179 domain-containing protein n=1 Tax=Paenibacillus segetis TaxID=1325360 RepID=A0ABQ1YT22_9BACL|nr:DUF4179 domain-containing protein [Paenibacillus segetis]GGH35453.1 hypothetical protein GCM10008013_41760 [Paenibacillus segetis]